MRKCLKENQEHYTVSLWHEVVALHVNGLKQSRICKKSIYESSYGERTIRYWHGHHDIPISMSHNVDWDPARLTINRLPARLKQFFHKFSTGNIGNRHKLCKRNESEYPRCLLCDHDVEKSSHVLLCNNDETKNNLRSSQNQI